MIFAWLCRFELENKKTRKYHVYEGRITDTFKTI